MAGDQVNSEEPNNRDEAKLTVVVVVDWLEKSNETNGMPMQRRGVVESTKSRTKCDNNRRLCLTHSVCVCVCHNRLAWPHIPRQTWTRLE